MQSSNPASKPLHILVVHRYFWPDTAPVAAILRSICDTMAEQGHEVSVLTSQPCYKPEVEIPKQPKREQLGKVRVNRIGLLPERRGAAIRKAVNFALFEWIVAWRLLVGPKQDLVMGLSFPPVINGLLLSLVARLRGAQFIYHIMDLHPESTHFSGGLSDGILYRIARRLDAGTCRRSLRTVVLSEDMAAMVRAREGLHAATNIRVIPNFNIPDYDDQQIVVPDQYQKPTNQFRLIFAGNIGNYQALPNLIDAAKLITDRTDIQWVFLGEGAAKARLIEQAGECNGRTIHFFPHQSPAVADAIVADADLAIVSLSPGIIRVANPCKTSTYLSMGCPLLVVMESDSHLFRTCRQERIGFACPPDDAQALAQTVIDAVDGTHNYNEMRIRARDYSSRHLERSVLLQRWKDLLSELEKPQCGKAYEPRKIG